MNQPNRAVTVPVGLNKTQRHLNDPAITLHTRFLQLFLGLVMICTQYPRGIVWLELTYLLRNNVNKRANWNVNILVLNTVKIFHCHKHCTKVSLLRNVLHSFKIESVEGETLPASSVPVPEAAFPLLVSDVSQFIEDGQAEEIDITKFSAPQFPFQERKKKEVTR